MNKRYIDFVPVDKGSAKRATMNTKAKISAMPDTSLAVRKGAPKRVRPKQITRKVSDEMPVEEIFEERARPAGVSTGLNEPKFGVIEDYHPKFVRAEVPKRPLGIAGGKTASKVGKSPTSALNHHEEKSKTPAPFVRANFINTNKVEKRPLSSSGANKRTTSFKGSELTSKAEEPKETKAKKDTKKSKKAKEPVRIIDNDKDSKAGMIVAVILTIILGAAAGTVAFLLLPK